MPPALHIPAIVESAEAPPDQPLEMSAFHVWGVGGDLLRDCPNKAWNGEVMIRLQFTRLSDVFCFQTHFAGARASKNGPMPARLSMRIH